MDSIVCLFLQCYVSIIWEKNVDSRIIFYFK